MKICLVCSHGGHLTEMEMLYPAMTGYEKFLVTYRSQRTEKTNLGQRKYLLDHVGTNAWRATKLIYKAMVILLRERPDVVLSIGAEIAIPFLWFGKLMGAKTVYIESWCRVNTKSLTGPLVYPIVDLFLIQWPSLANEYGPKAKYFGGLI